MKVLIFLAMLALAFAFELREVSLDEQSASAGWQAIAVDATSSPIVFSANHFNIEAGTDDGVLVIGGGFSGEMTQEDMESGKTPDINFSIFVANYGGLVEYTDVDGNNAFNEGDTILKWIPFKNFKTFPKFTVTTVGTAKLYTIQVQTSDSANNFALKCYMTNGEAAASDGKTIDPTMCKCDVEMSGITAGSNRVALITIIYSASGKSDGEDLDSSEMSFGSMGYVWEPTFTRNGAGSADIHSAQISYSKLVAGQTRDAEGIVATAEAGRAQILANHKRENLDDLEIFVSTFDFGASTTSVSWDPKMTVPDSDSGDGNDGGAAAGLTATFVVALLALLFN
eukprot:TRINITY_DN89_c0_g1_i1.p1 TRINITY_DN89_c0_g1~~TRINITY_DN89_c0_g1_i1.p1  ORF type:complete len:355 (+),score=116.52 TRINITY_DN89_c0_g1_i1:46-1065(+)